MAKVIMYGIEKGKKLHRNLFYEIMYTICTEQATQQSAEQEQFDVVFEHSCVVAFYDVCKIFCWTHSMENLLKRHCRQFCHFTKQMQIKHFFYFN